MVPDLARQISLARSADDSSPLNVPALSVSARNYNFRIHALDEI